MTQRAENWGMVQKISLPLQTSLKNTEHGPSVMATSSSHNNSTKYKDERDKAKELSEQSMKLMWLPNKQVMFCRPFSHIQNGCFQI